MFEADDGDIDLRGFFRRDAELATTTTANATPNSAAATTTNGLLLPPAAASTGPPTAGATAATATCTTAARAAKLGRNGNARKGLGQRQVERLLRIISNDHLGFVI